jgi:flagellar biosynthesis/type III secretory pathway protein FliH
MNIRHSNNYTIATQLFDNILNWAATKEPSKTKEQICADIEKVLDLVKDKDNSYSKGYDKGYRDGYNDGQTNSEESCCGKNR